MPPKKVTLPAFTKMEARVEMLVSEISEVQSTLEKSAEYGDNQPREFDSNVGKMLG